MAIEIIINKEPPRELIRIIEEDYGPEENIERVTIDTNSERIIGGAAIAGYFPETKEVIIDLARCVENKGWMGFGMMMIQTVWFNMLRAVWHELAHTHQLTLDPSIAEMAILTPKLEEEADKSATDMIYHWVNNGGVIPKIKDMGWASEQIKLIINTCYSNKELRPKILEELEVIEANGVAELDTFVAHNQTSFSKSEYDALCESIDNKKIGIKINNKRYLDPAEFFDLIAVNNKAAQDRTSEPEKEEAK